MENANASVTVTAADVLKTDHPLNAAFVRWLNGKDATKRQARKFLAAHPSFKAEKSA